MNRTIYSHAEGHSLYFCDSSNSLIATNACGQAVSLPIERESTGLKELCKALLDIVRHQEMAGHQIANNLLDELYALREAPQDEACRAIHASLFELSQLKSFDVAASGFAAQVVGVMQSGEKNWPLF